MMVDDGAMQRPVEVHSTLASHQADGMKVLIVASSVSLIAVVSLLVMIIIATLKTKYHKSDCNIFRSHVTTYLVSLLVSDLLQAVGSIMNTKWVQNMAVSLGGFCSVQGAIKQTADVGIAFWISAIAIHTFNVLVLGIHIRRICLYIVLIGGWCFIGAIVTMGPFILQKSLKGPYFGISGYWCWISKSYETEQLVLDYMMMFLSAATSFVLYVLVFLRLRGNLHVLPGGRFRLRSVDRKGAWTLHQSYEASDLQAYMASIAKHMLLYPIAYILLIVPIAACRFTEWMGGKVPLGAVIFSDTVFLLSGFANTLLFVLTGRVLPLREILSMLKTLFSRSDDRSAKPTAKTPGAREWEGETSTVYERSSSWTDELQHRFEKELPQLPLDSHHPTKHSISLGRRSSEVYTRSETSTLL